MLIENILIALNSIGANKLRAVLTMLGIIIGISSVIAIVTIGDSISSSVNKEMQSYGAKNIEIYVSNKNEYKDYSDENADTEDYSVSREMNESDMLSIKMLAEYEKDFKDKIKAISLEETLGDAIPKNKKFKSNINVLGTNSGYIDFNNITLLTGNYISDKDIENKANNIVVSDKFVKDFFGGKYSNEQALGKVFEIEVNKKILNLYIIGVYKFESTSHVDKNTPTKAFIPYTTAFHFNHKNPYFQNFKVVPKDEVDVKKFQLDTATYLSSYYTSNDSYSINTFGLTSMINSQNEMMNKLKLGISAIAAISLLVGGIGIMNIMMVSVTERTKEIGIRMALGAKGSIIRVQFIIEAIFISGIGGIIGIFLGIIIGSIGSKLMGFPSTPSIQAALIAISFSMAIGVFFGYYPANKAAKLDPIDALRYE